MDIDYEMYGRVVCAALFHNNCIYMAREGHHAIFPMEKIGVLKKSLQGFVTENGYFVDRKLAFQIATYYDQIITKHGPDDLLFSEDISKKEDIQIKRLERYSYKMK